MSSGRWQFPRGVDGFLSLVRGVRHGCQRLAKDLPSFQQAFLNRFRVRRIPLERTFLGGEGGVEAGRWAEIIGDAGRASMLLGHSPHVRFLQEYLTRGNAVFEARAFERTSYRVNALACIRHLGHYFGQTTAEGVLDQARAFAALFDRSVQGDRTEVRFPDGEGHSRRCSLPLVHRTLTPNTFRIVDGAHRLAIASVRGWKWAKAIALPPRPTDLQELALGVAQTSGRRELYQPIDSVEFDTSWGLVRRCRDRLDLMLTFLDERGLSRNRPSVLDLACSYGWFVGGMSRRGFPSMGVDPDPKALRIGQIAYGLSREQLVQSDAVTFAQRCNRRYDVVLLLSILHHFALKPSLSRPEDVLRLVDAITGSVLFLDTGQAHEQWFRRDLAQWDDQFIVEFIRRNTSFDEVLPLGADSDNVAPYEAQYGRTLFAAIRSAHGGTPWAGLVCAPTIIR